MTINAHWLFYGHTRMLSGTTVLVVLAAPNYNVHSWWSLCQLSFPTKSWVLLICCWGGLAVGRGRGSQVTRPVNSWGFLRCNPNINSHLPYVPSQFDVTPFLLGKWYQFLLTCMFQLPEAVLRLSNTWAITASFITFINRLIGNPNPSGGSRLN